MTDLDKSIPDDAVSEPDETILKSKPKQKRTYTEEQKEQMRERMIKINADRIENARRVKETLAKQKAQELKKLAEDSMKKPATDATLKKLEREIVKTKSKTSVKELERKKPQPKKKVIEIEISESESEEEIESEESESEEEIVILKKKPKAKVVAKKEKIVKEKPVKEKPVKQPAKSVEPEKQVICRFI